MFRKRRWTSLVVALVVADALAVGAALSLAVYLRLSGVIVPYTSAYNLMEYVRTILLAVPVWLLIFAAQRLYRVDSLLGGLGEYSAAVVGCTFGIVAIIVLSYFERGADLSRGWLLASWAISVLAVVGTRFLIRRVVFYLWRRGRLISRAVIVGANEQAKAIARQLQPPSASGIEVVGFVDDFLPIGTPVLEGLAVLASPRALPALTRQQRIAEIIVVPQAMAWESFQEILLSNGQYLDGARVRISPGFYELLTTGVRVDHKAFVPLLTPEKMRITGVDALLKSVFNYTFSVAGAILWLPALLVLMVSKRAAARGPVLQRQLVLGQGGKPLHVLEICLDPAVLTAKGDPVGLAQSLDRFLWRTGLYRLPQVVQVLCGQMNLVGPRPIPVTCDDDVRWDDLPSLLTVRPGITGPWVVFGTAHGSPEEERRMDLYYIRNWTIWLDFQILFFTAISVLTGRERSLNTFDDKESPWTSSNPT